MTQKLETSGTVAAEQQPPPFKVPANHPGLALPKSVLEYMDRRWLYGLIGLGALAFGGVSAFAMSSSKAKDDKPKSEQSIRLKLPQLPKEQRSASIAKIDAPQTTDAHVHDAYDDVDPNDPIFHTPITALPPTDRVIPGLDVQGHAAALAREQALEQAQRAQPAASKKSAELEDGEWGNFAPAADSLQLNATKQTSPEPNVESPTVVARDGNARRPEDEEPLSNSSDDQQEHWAARRGDIPRTTAWRDRARCQIDAGEPIEVQLLSAINTDIAGQNFTLRFMVDETVACGNRVAIRQGAKLAGSVNTRVAYGQNRVQACGNVIYMQPNKRHPNGYEIPLGCIPMAEASGAVGVPGEVNRHWGDKLSGGLFSMLFSIGPTAAAGTQTTFGSNVGQRVAQGAAQSAANTGQAWSNAAFARKDTIQLRGQTTRLIFNRAVVIPDGGEEP